MKQKIGKFVFIFWIIIYVTLIIGTVVTERNKINGNYERTIATITYVHNYVHIYRRSHKNDAANGYISWVYKGVTHHSEDEVKNYIDLIYGQKEGDFIIIWVDTKDGSFVEVDNKYQKSVKIIGITVTTFITILLSAFQISKRKKKKA